MMEGKFNSERLVRWFLAAGLGLASVCQPAGGAEQATPPPNIVLLLADDLGWADLGCYGSDLHRTPHIDQLAAGGLKLTDAYSACTVCSPTRASLMTGKYPARLHLTDFIAGQRRPFAKLSVPDWTKFLDPAEQTLAERLKQRGYATAQIGKWHLAARGAGGPSGGPSGGPLEHGFDFAVDKPPGARGYIIPDAARRRAGTTRDYVTDYLTDQAVEVIGRWRDRPYFLYMAYHTPHTPIQGRPDLVAKYRALDRTGKRHSNPEYAAMVESLDTSVGRIREALQQTGVAERTIVVFCSDNGGLSWKFGQPTGFTDNAPLRRGKGSAYEGGTRIPWIIHWPGVTRPGSTSGEPVCTIDLLPTIMDVLGLAGRDRPTEATDKQAEPGWDGVSLVPLCRAPGTKLPREALFWHYPHYHAGGDGPYGAVRAGDWKLVQHYETMRAELYDLDSDPGEQRDLARLHPERTRAMVAQLHAWREDVAAQMPLPNPDHDATKAERMARGLTP